MIKHARLLGPVLLLVLGGCAATDAAVRPAAAPDTVSESVEEGGKFAAFVGPRRQHGEPFLGIAGTNFYVLRSWIDRRTGETTHQLYVEDSYSGAKRQWNAAQDARGQPLRFVPISTHEISCDNGCAYAEEFAAALPEAALRASPQGLPVFFKARSGAQMAIPIPADLIAKQLAAVDRARAGVAAAAVAPAPGAAATPVAATAPVTR
jgi:hypothetical protein